MTTLRVDVLRLPTSPLGPPDPLPPLRSPADLHALEPAGDTVGLDEEMRRGMAYGRLSSVLPYLNQSDYGRELVETDHRTAVLENDRLRATFLLGWGGRLWSLVDLATGRELLHRPPALQLANLALRGAWFAGGVEWNLGLTGHTALTCEPLHAARVELADAEGRPAPLLRLYELERMRGLVQQVDAWLPDGSPHLLVHVTVTNPTAGTVPVYWWSNTAVPEAADVRVLTPATAAWTLGPDRVLRPVPFPVVDGVDRSYPVRSPAAVDHFVDAAGTGRPWIAALDGSGAGLVQSSTPRLRGRKLFVWGSGPGGRQWQRWLSPGGGRYLEIQAGLARTQLEHLPLPAGTRWTWLETYGPLQADPSLVHHVDPSVGVGAVQRALDRTAPRAWLEGAAVRLGAAVGQPPEEVLQTASGWGALERRRREESDEPSWSLPGTPFPDSSLGPEQEPWLELLTSGRVTLDLAAPPPSYQVAPAWRERLEAASGPAAALLRGVAQAWAGDERAAEASWRTSLQAEPSAWAWRNLGVLAAERDGAAAVEAYARARELAPDLASLAVEQLRVLLELGRAEELLSVLDGLPPELAGRPEVRLLEARAAVALGDVTRAGSVLEPGLVVPSLREGARVLEDLWYGYRALVLAKASGLSREQASVLARREPLPPGYDFTMAAPTT